LLHRKEGKVWEIFYFHMDFLFLGWPIMHSWVSLSRIFEHVSHTIKVGLMIL
jgi:hypothetical protein